MLNNPIDAIVENLAILIQYIILDCTFPSSSELPHLTACLFLLVCLVHYGSETGNDLHRLVTAKV